MAIAERTLGHEFSDRTLLQAALTHPSAAEDKDPAAYYERLEFLGDSIVGLVISEEVYRRFPDLTEGGMTRIKVSVVSGSTLANVAGELGLESAIMFGESEKGTGQRGLASALENVYEALTAALYLDADFETARRWVLATLGPLISSEAADSPENPKSLLQEVVQAKGATPVYRIATQSGPPHDRTFTAVVEVSGDVIGEGHGRSKKEAEAAAAAAAIERLSDEV
jgi:ribonuclease III